MVRALSKNKVFFGRLVGRRISAFVWVLKKMPQRASIAACLGRCCLPDQSFASNGISRSKCTESKNLEVQVCEESLNCSEAIRLIPRGVNLSAVKNECYVINQRESSQSIVSKTGHSASNGPSHDRKHRRRRRNPMKQKISRSTIYTE